MKRPSLLPVALAGLALTGGLAACGGSTTTSSSSSPAVTSVGAGASASGSPSSSGATGRITVFAAASLKESFTTIGERFEAANPGTDVTFSYGPSSGLATQITQGAPADVFASASQKTMDAVVAAGAAADPSPFATNVLEIVVPPANPGKVTSLADLARPGVKVALCQPQVPCGTVAAKVLANAGLTVQPVTLEADVRATLTKVQLGEVDAGLVYVTDVKAAGDKVTGIEIPADVNASTTYPIATTTTAGNAAAAKAFVAYVLSADGRAVLTEAGFAQP